MQLPKWALEKAGPQDRVRAQDAYQRKTGHFIAPEWPSLREWMRAREWKYSWLSKETAFYKQCFRNDDNFRAVLEDQIAELWIPKQSHQVSEDDLASIDKDYSDRAWSSAVAQLKDLRRAIDAGITIKVDGRTFTSSGSFYTWVHKRYHALEEASDDWIMEG